MHISISFSIIKLRYPFMIHSVNGNRGHVSCFMAYLMLSPPSLSLNGQIILEFVQSMAAGFTIHASVPFSVIGRTESFSICFVNVSGK